eukprot:CAMPEP_0183319602 /NCGR_PEP_ID=MMETSP0160_2-20130417/64109_1 /TAXON_ID=2839 ORGANISM="Odontella Sinensis, Strain Grunow 1884" /NCGR_SAMPLE_ID=MMETSP0160_2 /ASSEMBLY_ACC=CAM_ASM_000250 /LENGTH=117 /DNA_ID=CAMNT_0025486115 /DNA_START=200 /DNA_END=550 /DNA_ORIENTATION=+
MSQALKVGDKVLGNFEGSGRWVEARIESIQDPDTCHIRFQSGEYFTGAHLDVIREFRPFEEGDKVHAVSRRSGKWHSGTIAKVHPLGTYDVDFDSGGEERHLEHDLIIKDHNLEKPV